MVQIEADESEEQGQWNDARHDNGRAPVLHKEKHDEGDEENAFQDIVKDGVYG